MQRDAGQGLKVVFQLFEATKPKQVERPSSPYESILIRLRFEVLWVWREQ